MNKYVFISFLLATLFGLPALGQKADWARHGRYAAANSELAPAAPDEHRVVFMGNSITDYWINHSPEFFKDNNYIDRGIGGQTSYQMLVRFRSDVVDLNPEAVVINAGTNDCAENTHPFDADITMGNIMSMVEIARANGIKVILASVLPAASFGWAPAITDAPERINKLNGLIHDYAAKQGIPYVDYYSAMVYGDNKELNPAYCTDGVHPNKEGYSVMEAIVKPVIDKVVTE